MNTRTIRSLVLLFWVAAGLAVLRAPAAAEAPGLLTYQGRLKESGVPVTGARSVDINLCNDPGAGTCYSTTAQNVAVVNGLFRTTFSAPSSVNLETGDWWIEVHVGPLGGPLVTLSPREQISSSPYAIIASSAATLIPRPSASGVAIGTHVYVVGSTLTVQGKDASGYSLALSSGIYMPLGIVNANYYLGDGSHLTGIVATVLPSSVAFVTQPNIFVASQSVVAGGGLGVTYGITAGSVTATSSITASAFFGDGSHLANVTATDNTKVAKAGDTMTGPLTVFTASITVVDNNSSHFYSLAATTAPDRSVYHLYVATTGNVGIGTSNPVSLLSLSGAASTITLQTGGAVNFQGSGGNTSSLSMSAISGSPMVMDAQQGITLQTQGGKQVQVGAQSSGSGGVNVLISPNGGSVGIGTAIPALTLDVNGGAQVGAGASKSTFTTAGSLFMASGSSITLSGTNGYITSASSVNASAFFGDGSHLSNITATVVPSSVAFTTVAQIFVASQAIVAGGGLGVTYGISAGSITATTGLSGIAIATNVYVLGSTLAVLGNGNVGLGIANPLATLDVHNSGLGTAFQVSGFPGLTFSINGANGEMMYAPNNTLGGSVPVVAFGNNTTGSNSGTDFFQINPANGMTGGTLLNVQSSGNSRMLVTASGNIGINTTNPAQNLDVNGTVVVGSGTFRSTFTALGSLFMASGSSITLSGANGYITSASSINAAAFFGDGSHLSNLSDNTKVAKLGDTMTGPLTVYTASVTVVDNTASHAYSLAVTTVSNQSAYHLYVATSGKVGIGTSLPGQLLDVAGTENVAGPLFIGGLEALSAPNNTDIQYGFSASVANQEFYTGAVERMRVNSAGNLGVGTASPGALLDVNGNMQVGSGTAKSTFTTLGALFMASGSSITLSGTNGYITSGSSITAAAFFGDGSHLNLSGLSASVLPSTIAYTTVANTFVASQTVTAGGGLGVTYGIAAGSVTTANLLAPLNQSGITIATNVYVLNSTLTVTGQDQNGYSLGLSSGLNMPAGTVNAKNFVGNGAGLTNVSDVSKVAKAGDTMTGPLTVYTASITVVDNTATHLYSMAVTTAPDRSVYHLYVATTGRVGIGTPNPAFPLHVHGVGTGQTAGMFEDDDPSFTSLYLNALGGGSPIYGYLRGGILKAYTGVDSAGNWGLTMGGATPLLVQPGSRVGVGVGTPVAQLHVSSASAVSSDTIFQASSGTAAGQELFVVKGDGKVGVGTAGPANTLDVNGGFQVGGGAVKSTFTSAGALFMASGSSITLSGSGGYITSASSITAAAFFGDASHLTGGNFVRKTGDTMSGQLSIAGSSLTVIGNGTGTTTDSYSLAVTTTGGVYHLYVATTGAVGIGTAAVQGTRLTIPGFASGITATSSFGLNVTDGSGTSALLIRDDGRVGIGTTNLNSPFVVGPFAEFNNGIQMLGSLTMTNPGNSVRFPAQPFAMNMQSNSTSGQWSLQFGNELPAVYMTITNGTGNVGVGTTSPVARLHVSSASAVSSDTIFQASSGTAAGQELFVVKGDGKVGVGTAGPANTLDVNGGFQVGGGAVKSTFTSAGALFMASGSSITLSGSGGYITSASSITAAAFFGDGSHLTYSGGPISPSVLPSTIAYTTVAQIFVASQAVTAGGGLGVTYGLSAGSATISGSLTASTLTVTGQDSSGLGAKFSHTVSVSGSDSSGLSARFAYGVSAGSITVLSPLAGLSISTAVSIGTTTFAGLFTVGASSLTVLANGNVGISSAVPGANLDIFSKGGQPALRIVDNGPTGQVLSIDGTTGGVIFSPNVISGSPMVNFGANTTQTSGGDFFVINPANFGSGGPLLDVQSSNVTRMIVLSSGAVGVGTAIPSYLVHIATVAGVSTDLLVVSTGTTNMFKVNGLGQVTAATYFGDGSNLTGVSPNGAVKKTGDTMTGALTVIGSSIAISGSTLTVNGPIISTGIAGGVVFTGGGTRFEWIPSSAAIRAGAVLGSEWDSNNIGAYSVAFGSGTTASGAYSMVGGGLGNSATVQDATVVGGDYNTANNTEATVGGGAFNQASGIQSVVAGGQNNLASAQNATVAGGTGNSAKANYAAVLGGQSSTIVAAGTHGVIGGGDFNGVAADEGTVSGGGFNNANGQSSTVGGGHSNTAGGTNSTVAGGQGNSAAGLSATVPGGSGNSASGNYSFAGGQGATATARGSFVWSDSQGGLLGTTTDQFLVRSQGGFQVTAGSFTFLGSAGSGGFMGVGTAVPFSSMTVAGTFGMSAMPAPALSGNNQGTIYFDNATNKFRVSESGGSFQNLLSAGNFVSKTGDTMTGGLFMSASSITVSGSTLTVQGPIISTGPMTLSGSTLTVTGTDSSGNSASFSGGISAATGTFSYVTVNGSNATLISATGSVINSSAVISVQSIGSAHSPAASLLAGPSPNVVYVGENNPSGNATVSLITKGAPQLSVSSGGDASIGAGGTPVTGTRWFVQGAAGATGDTYSLQVGSNSSSYLLAVTTTGFTGVGTGIPSAWLQVEKDGASASDTVLQVSSGPAGSEVLVVKGDGRVGVGIVPAAGDPLVQIQGQPSMTKPLLQVSDINSLSSGDKLLQLSTGTGALANNVMQVMGDGRLVAGNIGAPTTDMVQIRASGAAVGSLSLKDNGGNEMRMQAGTNGTVGNYTLSSSLDIYASNNPAIRIDQNGDMLYGAGAGGGTVQSGVRMLVTGQNSDNYLLEIGSQSITAASPTALVMDMGGRTGLGTRSPGGRLELLEQNSGSAFIFKASTGSAAYSMVVTTQSTVGIGTLTPGATLQVNGDVGLGDGTNTGNKPLTVWLNNASGGLVSYGEIVIAANGVSNSFTVAPAGGTGTSTTTVLGVVYESGGIGANVSGRIAVAGIAQVQSTGSPGIGNHVVTSTISGLATGTGSPIAGASLGVWLESPSGSGALARALLGR